jgi:DNA-binding HxlR family transcriptional regulator
MERKQFSKVPCSIARSLDVIGDWWTPMIVRECLYGNHRFDEIQNWIGISRNILTRRLTQLVDQGVLERRPYQERPPRFEYHLTEQGYSVAKLLLVMMPFGEKWFFEPDREPIRLYDRKTGRRIRPVVVDEETGKPIDPRELFPGPGPAFPKSEKIRKARFQEYYARNQDG